jgi:hypothetical protein
MLEPVYLKRFVNDGKLENFKLTWVQNDDNTIDIIVLRKRFFFQGSAETEGALFVLIIDKASFDFYERDAIEKVIICPTNNLEHALELYTYYNKPYKHWKGYEPLKQLVTGYGCINETHT